MRKRNELREEYGKMYSMQGFRKIDRWIAVSRSTLNVLNVTRNGGLCSIINFAPTVIIK
jgi:hypothetical protein